MTIRNITRVSIFSFLAPRLCFIEQGLVHPPFTSHKTSSSLPPFVSFFFYLTLFATARIIKYDVQGESLGPTLGCPISSPRPGGPQDRMSPPSVSGRRPEDGATPRAPSTPRRRQGGGGCPAGSRT